MPILKTWCIYCGENDAYDDSTSYQCRFCSRCCLQRCGANPDPACVAAVAYMIMVEVYSNPVRLITLFQHDINNANYQETVNRIKNTLVRPTPALHPSSIPPHRGRSITVPEWIVTHCDVRHFPITARRLVTGETLIFDPLLMVFHRDHFTNRFLLHLSDFPSSMRWWIFNQVTGRHVNYEDTIEIIKIYESTRQYNEQATVMPPFPGNTLDEVRQRFLDDNRILIAPLDIGQSLDEYEFDEVFFQAINSSKVRVSNLEVPTLTASYWEELDKNLRSIVNLEEINAIQWSRKPYPYFATPCQDILHAKMFYRMGKLVVYDEVAFNIFFRLITIYNIKTMDLHRLLTFLKYEWSFAWRAIKDTR